MSHHVLGAFFSGQDINTLRVEGDDTNCFVSLIVDTRGTYQAAITRKIQKKTEVVTKSLGSSYEFFGEGEIKTGEDSMTELTRIVDEEVIEYFMLDVEREIVDNPLEMLDRRFDEIEEQKKQKQLTENSQRQLVNPMPANTGWNLPYNVVKDEPTLFSKNEMGEIENEEAFYDDMPDEIVWNPDEKDIHYMICQMLTCSLIVDKGVDLKQWVTRHMMNKYKDLFKSAMVFNDYVEFIIEFQMNRWILDNVPPEYEDNVDLFQSILAKAMYKELSKYPSNEYIEVFKKVLLRYE